MLCHRRMKFSKRTIKSIRMRKFRFDKLVRDKIPADIENNGNSANVRQLKGEQYLESLRAKLVEESQEIPFDDRAEAAKELADLQEIIDCMAQALGIDRSEIAAQQAAKREKVGSFFHGLYIETVTVADDDPMVGYYESNSDRYPEVK